MNDTLFDRLFRDGTGEIVIGQPPNLPIVIWVSATLLKLVFKTGQVNIALDLLAFSSLLYWSFLEITQGANYFRRDLGVVVLIALIISVIGRLDRLGGALRDRIPVISPATSA
jgi:hypothetical protein